MSRAISPTSERHSADSATFDSARAARAVWRRVEPRAEQRVVGSHGGARTRARAESHLALAAVLDRQLHGRRRDGQEALRAQLATAHLIKRLGWRRCDIRLFGEYKLALRKAARGYKSLTLDRVKVVRTHACRDRNIRIDEGARHTCVRLGLFLLLAARRASPAEAPPSVAGGGLSISAFFESTLWKRLAETSVQSFSSSSVASSRASSASGTVLPCEPVSFAVTASTICASDGAVIVCLRSSVVGSKVRMWSCTVARLEKKNPDAALHLSRIFQTWPARTFFLIRRAGFRYPQFSKPCGSQSCFNASHRQQRFAHTCNV